MNRHYFSVLLVLLSTALALIGCAAKDSPTAPAPTTVALLSPPADATLDNGCTDFSNELRWDFDWADVAGADKYEILVMDRNVTLAAADVEVTPSAFTFSENGWIGTNGSLGGWFWQVRAHVNGNWGPWTDHRTFAVERTNTDCPSLPQDGTAQPTTTGSIGILVTNAVTGARISGANLFLFGPHVDNGWKALLPVVTDASGAYTFSDLQIGTYVVSVAAPTFIGQVYDNICPVVPTSTCSVVMGTPIVVTVGATTSIKIALAPQ